jgi:hypothetical protein
MTENKKNHKIVFFIRALFKESMMPEVGHGSMAVDARQCAEEFDKLFKISIHDYRKKVHQIQLSCIKNISDRIIYNHVDKKIKSTWKLPYVHIQDSAREELMALRDDDIIIPLDDDDWLSPEISELDFPKNSLILWDAVSIGVDSTRTCYCYRHPQLPAKLDMYSERVARGLLSNCYGFRAKIIKEMLRRNEEDADMFLLRHTMPRILARKKEYKDLFQDGETITKKFFGIYVKHAANITLYNTLKSDKITIKDHYLSAIKEYTYDFEANIENFPAEFAWSIPYYKKLRQLNLAL